MNGLEFINTVKSRIEHANASYNNTGSPTYKKIDTFIVEYTEEEMELVSAYFKDWQYADGFLTIQKDKAMARIRWIDYQEISGSKTVLAICDGKLQPTAKFINVPALKANVTFWLGVDIKKARKEHLKMWYEDVKAMICEEL